MLLIQTTDLKEKTKTPGADNARKSHHPEKYIRTLRRTRDRPGIEVDVGVAGSKYGPA
jgi:hypothetical protein